MSIIHGIYARLRGSYYAYQYPGRYDVVGDGNCGYRAYSIGLVLFLRGLPQEDRETALTKLDPVFRPTFETVCPGQPYPLTKTCAWMTETSLTAKHYRQIEDQFHLTLRKMGANFLQQTLNSQESFKQSDIGGCMQGLVLEAGERHSRSADVGKQSHSLIHSLANVFSWNKLPDLNHDFKQWIKQSNREQALQEFLQQEISLEKNGSSQKITRLTNLVQCLTEKKPETNNVAATYAFDFMQQSDRITNFIESTCGKPRYWATSEHLIFLTQQIGNLLDNKDFSCQIYQQNQLGENTSGVHLFCTGSHYLVYVPQEPANAPTLTTNPSPTLQTSCPAKLRLPQAPKSVGLWQPPSKPWAPVVGQSAAVMLATVVLAAVAILALHFPPVLVIAIGAALLAVAISALIAHQHFTSQLAPGK